MKPETDVLKNKTCILVEGPAWGNAEFYGNWLLNAAKASGLSCTCHITSD